MRRLPRPRSIPSQQALDRGYRAMAHRASVANAWRRFDAGDAVTVCFRCGCEADQPARAHAGWCDDGRGAKRRPIRIAGFEPELDEEAAG